MSKLEGNGLNVFMSDFTSGQNRLKDTIARISTFVNADVTNDTAAHIYSQLAIDQQQQARHHDPHITSMDGKNEGRVEHLQSVLQNDVILSAMLNPIQAMVDKLRDDTSAEGGQLLSPPA